MMLRSYLLFTSLLIVAIQSVIVKAFIFDRPIEPPPGSNGSTKAAVVPSIIEPELRTNKAPIGPDDTVSSSTQVDPDSDWPEPDAGSNEEVPDWLKAIIGMTTPSTTTITTTTTTWEDSDDLTDFPPDVEGRYTVAPPSTTTRDPRLPHDVNSYDPLADGPLPTVDDGVEVTTPDSIHAETASKAWWESDSSDVSSLIKPDVDSSDSKTEEFPSLDEIELTTPGSVSTSKPWWQSSEVPSTTTTEMATTTTLEDPDDLTDFPPDIDGRYTIPPTSTTTRDPRLPPDVNSYDPLGDGPLPSEAPPVSGDDGDGLITPAPESFETTTMEPVDIKPIDNDPDKPIGGSEVGPNVSPTTPSSVHPETASKAWWESSSSDVSSLPKPDADSSDSKTEELPTPDASTSSSSSSDESGSFPDSSETPTTTFRPWYDHISDCLNFNFGIPTGRCSQHKCIPPSECAPSMICCQAMRHKPHYGTSWGGGEKTEKYGYDAHRPKPGKNRNDYCNGANQAKEFCYRLCPLTDSDYVRRVCSWECGRCNLWGK